MAHDYVIYYTLWFLITIWLIWRLHDDHKASQQSLERIAEIQRDIARILGTDRH